MFELACGLLGDAGYGHYEISNWAKPGYECRHNLGYWERRPYVGLGAGAHAYRDGRRWWNVRPPEEYLSMVERGELPVGGSEELEPADAYLEEVFLRLRILQGIPASWVDDGRAEPYLESGLLHAGRRASCPDRTRHASAERARPRPHRLALSPRAPSRPHRPWPAESRGRVRDRRRRSRWDPDVERTVASRTSLVSWTVFVSPSIGCSLHVVTSTGASGKSSHRTEPENPASPPVVKVSGCPASVATRRMAGRGCEDRGPARLAAVGRAA